MQNRQQGHTQKISAAKAGISERTARRIDHQSNPPAAKPRHWRTRKDPLATIWESELLPLLQTTPGLTGLTLMDYLDERYPDVYPSSLLRTLQRRVKFFNATQGEDKPVIFRQEVPMGQLGLSDFSHPNDAITINGKPFTHLLYQFRLAYSGWRYAQPIQGGESFAALSEGLQNALTQLGGVPIEHRTDSLSAAFNNLSEQQALTRDYQGLCAHYGLKASRNNKGISHENGAIETAHRSLKHRLRQALKLRGNHDFKTLAEYQRFIGRQVDKLNAQSGDKIQQERAQLQSLPSRRYMDYQVQTLKVTRTSTIDVKRVTYSVPSRLIGEVLSVHVHHDRLELYLAQTRVLTLTRLHVPKGQARARQIDFKHLINALAAKPQAFRYSSLQAELLPDDNYKQLWLEVDSQLESKAACKWMVGVLKVAAQLDDYQALGETLLMQAKRRQLPTLQAIQDEHLPQACSATLKPFNQHRLADYDHLLHSNTPSQGAVQWKH